MPVQFVEDALRVDRVGALHCPLIDHLPPFSDARLNLLAPGTVSFALEIGDKRPQRLGAVALQRYLHRVAQAEPPPADVDLYAARLPLFRQELGVGEVGSDHEQGIATHHHIPAWLCAEQANGAGDKGQRIGQGRYAEQGLRHARAEQISYLGHFFRSVHGPRPDQYGNALALVEDVRGLAQVFFLRHYTRHFVDKAGMYSVGRVRRCGDGRHLLYVFRHDHTGHGTFRQGNAKGAVDQLARLHGRIHLVDISTDIVKEARQIHFLLERAACPTMATTGW